MQAQRNATDYVTGDICSNPWNSHTVNKLRSLNLHFSCMFRIESKIVHVGAEKIITLY
jgi:hypothetical protein